MTTYYYKHGIPYQTKTMCNLVETWQHECRVYPDEIKARPFNIWGMSAECPDGYIRFFNKDRDFRNLS